MPVMLPQKKGVVMHASLQCVAMLTAALPCNCRCSAVDTAIGSGSISAIRSSFVFLRLLTPCGSHSMTEFVALSHPHLPQRSCLVLAYHYSKHFFKLLVLVFFFFRFGSMCFMLLVKSVKCSTPIHMTRTVMHVVRAALYYWDFICSVSIHSVTVKSNTLMQCKFLL